MTESHLEQPRSPGLGWFPLGKSGTYLIMQQNRNVYQSHASQGWITLSEAAAKCKTTVGVIKGLIKYKNLPSISQPYPNQHGVIHLVKLQDVKKLLKQRHVYKRGDVEVSIRVPGGTWSVEPNMGSAARRLSALYPKAVGCRTYVVQIDDGKTANARLYIKRDIAHGNIPADSVRFSDETST